MQVRRNGFLSAIAPQTWETHSFQVGGQNKRKRSAGYFAADKIICFITHNIASGMHTVLTLTLSCVVLAINEDRCV